MGALWCQKFPVVSVPQTDKPTPFTLVVPYYENRAFFGAQIRHWLSFPEPLRKHLKVIVVDDGSPEQPAESVVKAFGTLALPFLRLFRIEVDIRWNWLAAKNIGFHYADEGWVLATDMDHVLPSETLRALLFGQHDPSCVYALNRREHTGLAIHPHDSTYFVTRERFWKSGGYDEALSGHYGTSGEFRKRLAAVAKYRILPSYMVRHEYQHDSSTTRYQRKQPEDAAVKKLIAKRKPGWKPKTLSFPYHEVQL